MCSSDLNNEYNPEFLDKVSLFFECILTISTNIVNKMGYSIDTLIHYEEKDIIYPNNSVFAKATNAITFNISDISKFIGRELENELEINFSGCQFIAHFDKCMRKSIYYHKIVFFEQKEIR